MLAVLLLCVASSAVAADAADSKAPAKVAISSKVSVEFTLSVDGAEFENNVGGPGWTFEYGVGQIIPGLDTALTGMAVGESKTFTIAPEMGYGPIHEEAFRQVPLEVLPEDARKVGAQVVAHEEAGELILRVDRIEGDSAVLDANHPLAGKTLTFDIKILGIE